MPRPSAEPRSSARDDGGLEPHDRELVVRSQAGDMRAFDILVTRYRGRIYAMVQNLVRNETDAWDIAQEAFLKAWRALPRFKGDAAFYTWLYRITHNVAYDWLRKRRIEPGIEFDDSVRHDQMDPAGRTAPRGDLQPDAQLNNRELGDRIRDAMNKLSADHRQTIFLKEVQGLKYHEIAAVMECSEGTVMSRLFYARKKLQELLRDTYEAIH